MWHFVFVSELQTSRTKDISLMKCVIVTVTVTLSLVWQLQLKSLD